MSPGLAALVSVLETDPAVLRDAFPAAIEFGLARGWSVTEQVSIPFLRLVYSQPIDEMEEAYRAVQAELARPLPNEAALAAALHHLRRLQLEDSRRLVETFRATHPFDAAQARDTLNDAERLANEP